MASRSYSRARPLTPELIASSPLAQARAASSDAPLFIEEITVDEAYDGWRIDRFLATIIPRSSRTQVQGYLKNNVELVPPRRVKPSGPVRTGDIIRIVRTEHVLPGLPNADDLLILAQHEDTAVISKPPGILVHRNSREVSHTVDAFLAQRFPHAPQVEAVHRLDRETSGCMLAALNKEAVATWRVAFQQRGVRKVYLSIVDDPSGVWRIGESVLIDAPLGPDPDSVLSVRMGRGTLSARTRVIPRQRDGQRVLLEMHPVEGRQHQLRAHLYLYGTPILGDKLYAAGDAYFMRWSDDPMKSQRDEPLETPFHCLHAWKLTLPRQGVEETFVAPLPPHFLDAMPALTAPR